MWWIISRINIEGEKEIQIVESSTGDPLQYRGSWNLEISFSFKSYEDAIKFLQ